MSERVYIQFKLGLLLDPTLHKVAISLPELVSQTNAFSVKNRPGCTPTLLDSNPQDLFLHYNVKCNLATSDPNGHDVRVHFDVGKVNETQQAKDLDVRCSCSCPAFLYWGAQWNLHQRDGLEGEPRPLLTAPTERLDLRAHFVICKHCKAVFERILPAVQHNIVNLLRKREVERNKQKQKETEPGKLRENQERMKRRNLIDKIRKVKNKKLQEKMLEQLKRQEEEHLDHIIEINKEEEKIQEGKNPHEVSREAPATLPESVKEQRKPAELPAWLQLPEHYQKKRTPEEDKAIEDLLRQEEERMEEE